MRFLAPAHFFGRLRQPWAGLFPTVGRELAMSMKGLGEATVKEASLAHVKV
jgi:hypothetical protein